MFLAQQLPNVCFNTLIITYRLKENEYSNAFQNVITLDELFV